MGLRVVQGCSETHRNLSTSAPQVLGFPVCFTLSRSVWKVQMNDRHFVVVVGGGGGVFLISELGV